jgi:hypothetical protein
MYDRGRQGPGWRRRTHGCKVAGKGTSQSPFDLRGLIFELAFDAARFTRAQQPLAFTVADLIHGHTAVVATVRGGRAGRFSHGLVTSWPIAKNWGMFFCCVTTRRSDDSGHWGLPFLRHVRPRGLPLPSLPFRLGMLPASFRGGAAFLLPLGCLPAMQRFQAFRFSAVALIVPACLKSPPAAFAKTSSPPQPPTPGTRIAFVGMLNVSHGR